MQCMEEQQVAGYSDGMVLGVHIRREKQEDQCL